MLQHFIRITSTAHQVHSGSKLQKNAKHHGNKSKHNQIYLRAGQRLSGYLSVFAEVAAKIKVTQFF